MIILPIGENSAPAPLQAAASRPAPLQSTVRLMVFGFSPAERELIHGTVALSQRRSLRLQLVSDTPANADVILIDGADAKVTKWARRGSLPQDKPLIQVGGQALPGVLHLQRPVPWPNLPALLQQALRYEVPNSAHQPLSIY